MRKDWCRVFGIAVLMIAALSAAGCINPIVDSWSGETVDDALITYQGVTYDILTLQTMNIPPGNYEVIITSPNHHPLLTTITVGSADVPPIRLVPYRRIYSPLVADAMLCRGIDMLGTPIGPGWSYTPFDAQVVAWVRWNIYDSNFHYQITRWYRPDGVLYKEEALPPFARTPGSVSLISAPGLPLQVAPGWNVPAPASLPGIWVVEVFLDGSRAVKMSFSI